MAMNAVAAARTVDFGSSLAFDPALRSGVAPADVYRLGAEIAFGRERGSLTLKRVLEALRSQGSPDLLQERLSTTAVDNLRLSPEQIEVYLRLAALSANDDRSAQEAIERSFAEDGKGVPAVAILILLVVVLVAVVAQQ